MNGSDLEQIFAYQLRCQGAHWPVPVREHTFLPGRKWRFDFAWPDVKVAVEVDGGVWSQGRHTRGAGFVNDMEKFNEAAIAGWLVLRLSEKHLDDLSGLRWLERALHGKDSGMIYVAGAETGFLVAVVALTVWSWRTSPCYRMLRAQRRQDRRDLQTIRQSNRGHHR